MYVSPQIDNGYDIANYRDIDPSYGCMADFEQLIAQAHQRGIKIVMDMVFNHSSTFHRWFVEGEDPNSEYHDYYIWRESLTNWKSKFGGSAWKWSDKAQKYYLHLFAPEQADLNWENSKLREELFDICKFWAEKGIDGLRLDVVNLISKPEQFEDEPEGWASFLYGWTENSPIFTVIKSTCTHSLWLNDGWRDVFDDLRKLSKICQFSRHRTLDDF